MQSYSNAPQNKRIRKGNVATCLTKSEEEIKRYVERVVHSFPDKIGRLKEELTQFHRESTVDSEEAIELAAKWSVRNGMNQTNGDATAEDMIDDLRKWANGEMKQLIISRFMKLKQETEKNGMKGIIRDIDPDDELFNAFQKLGETAIKNIELRNKSKMALEYLDTVLKTSETKSEKETAENRKVMESQGTDASMTEQCNWYDGLDNVVDMNMSNPDAVQYFKNCMTDSKDIHAVSKEENNETNELITVNEGINDKLKEIEKKISQLHAIQQEAKEKQNINGEKISDHSEKIETLIKQQEKLRSEQKPLLEYLDEKNRINAEREKLMNSVEQVKVFYQTFLTDLSGALLALFLLQNKMELITAEKGKVLNVSKKGNYSSSAVSAVKTLSTFAETTEGFITKIASINPDAISIACDILGKVGEHILSISEKVIDTAHAVESVPFLGLGINLAKKGVDYGIKKYEENKIKNTRHYFLGLTPKSLEKISDSISRKIALSYQDQIKLLNTKGSKHLARCGVECLIVNLLNNSIKLEFEDIVLNFLLSLRFQPITQDSWKLLGFKTSLNLPFSTSLLLSAENEDKGYTAKMIYCQTGYSYEEGNGLRHYLSNDIDKNGTLPLPGAPETSSAKVGYMLITKDEFNKVFHKYALPDNISIGKPLLKIQSDLNEKSVQPSEHVISHSYAELKNEIDLLKQTCTEQKQSIELLTNTLKTILCENEDTSYIEKSKFLFSNIDKARNIINQGIKKPHQSEKKTSISYQQSASFFSQQCDASSKSIIFSKKTCSPSHYSHERK